MTTLSVIKADIGGYVGHASMHPDLMGEGERHCARAKQDSLLIDYKVMRCGDDLELIMTHEQGVDNERIHKFAWETFGACADVARKLKLYGAGQDLIADAFAGNVRGMGPGLAEMDVDERPSEPVIIFMADKTSAGAWNMPLYKMFSDPFNTAGLVIAPGMHEGFLFEVQDVVEHKKITFKSPEEIYDLLMFIGAPSRYTVKAVYSRNTNQIAAVSSTERLSLIAGKYVGKDDPVCIVRCQGAFPAVGEVLEPFSMPQMVEGWMRGSHHGPLMPVCFAQANPSRFDGPPRVVAAGFQIANGELVGPLDMFDDPSFDTTREWANQIGEYLRRHGPFEPHRLPLPELEYTTMPAIMERCCDRWQPL